ncbi:hypothetical protein T492DRAFT_952252 [Pavlovales sp. CCMP2436]|nr:hypothetical protein T492DRAFT_952252 [Pavlovales sp. CCMP2436]
MGRDCTSLHLLALSALFEGATQRRCPCCRWCVRSLSELPCALAVATFTLHPSCTRCPATPHAANSAVGTLEKRSTDIRSFRPGCSALSSFQIRPFDHSG